MAAEVLEQLDAPELLPASWTEGARAYPALATEAVAQVARLGVYADYGRWWQFYMQQLARTPWPVVVAREVPRLTPGLSGAVQHGLIRTAHAVRALMRAETLARHAELAAGLAYWAARYTELLESRAGPELEAPLVAHVPVLVGENEEVPFDEVDARLARVSVPPVTAASLDLPADEALAGLVGEASTVFLEMLVQERHRIWLLHMVTGPACAALLAPVLAPVDARRLAAHSRRAAIALHRSLAAPCRLREHLGPALAWEELLAAARTSGSVHTLKLVEALARFRSVEDELLRSTASHWLAWK